MTTSIITSNHQEMQFNALSLPDKEIEQIFNLQGTLNVQELLDIFQTIIGKISSWLESVHLALFSLEQNINQENLGINDLASLEKSINQMVPTISSLSELNDVMLTSGVEEQLTRLKVTKIQSEWSSLQHYLASVKQQVLANKEQSNLTFDIEKLLVQIDDISVMIFDFQEKKQYAISPTSSLSEKVNNNDDVFSIGSSSDGSTLVNMTASGVNREDNTMAEIDQVFDTTLQAVQAIHTKFSQLQPQELTKKRFEKLKDRWEQLEIEREEFKHEHKEDRWSTVFRRVSDQVDVMIDGLDRSVTQCYSFIQQIKTWFQQQQQQSSYKSLLRSFQHKSNTCPIDIEKFKSVEKGFEAKFKYYTPSIDRMLTILGSGISTRGSKDITIQQRHESMSQRWSHLKEVMNELRSGDLVETDRIISGNQHTKKVSSWKEIRYRTPEPTTETSPRSPALSQPPPSPLRSSISDSSSSSSTHLLKKTTMPKLGRNESIQSKKEDFYEEDERHFGVDLMKPKKNARRILPHQIERPSTTQDIRPRTKTPNSYNKRIPNTPQPKAAEFRSKTSLGDVRKDRVMSPSVVTRSRTPSLIPRSKTPKDMSRTASPMIPQNRTHKTKNLSPIPIPSKYATNSTLRKKQSMPLLRHKPSIMEISVNENGAYRADPKDPLDIEVAQIINASPIAIRCQRTEQGKYYFGNELSLSSMGGKKLYTCKLMTYTDRKNGKLKNNKVLIRVGGGWQDLEFFLLEHSSLMASDVVVRTYTGNSKTSSPDLSSRQSPKGWKN
ncbi:unnamed protein product [Rhizopus stolonifer]